MSFCTIPDKFRCRMGALGMARWFAACLLAVLLGIAIQPARAAVPSAQSARSSAAPSYGALASLLENKDSRDALIKQLRTLAAKSEGKLSGQQAPPVPTGETAGGQAGFLAGAGDMAATLQSFTVSFSHNVETMADMFSRRGWVAGAYVKGLETVPGLLAVIASTIIALFVLRACAMWAYRRLDDWVSRLGADLATTGHRALAPRELYCKMGAIALGFLVDLATVLLAAAVGYGVVLYGVVRHLSAQAPGAVFVSAFLAVEATCALARVVFATRYPDLRLIRMTDGVAGFWNAWLARLIRITGYGLLVAVPVAQTLLLSAAGKVLGLLIMLGVYVYAVRVIWTNRHLLRERMMARAAELSAPLMSTLLRVLARIWHVLGIAYFTELLIASQVNPEDALPFMAQATIQTLAAVGVGVLLSLILTAMLSRRIHLSEDMRARLPMLENRINAYVPATLRALRLFILFVVALVVLDAWHAFNLAAWMVSASGRAVLTTVVRVAVILLAAAFVWTVVASIIESRLSGGTGRHRPSDREKTLLSLFRNASLIVIITFTVLVVLSQVGIAIGPLIAGAGVVGLAIGFGAQKLVQDVITGVFIQLENGMNQNDVVELAGLFGTVEKITIRSVVVRTLDGGYHLIPFSTVDKLTNHTRDFGYHYGEYNIGYREDADNVIAHLEHAFDELMQDSELAPHVMERISIPGVTSLTERGFTVRVLIKTVPGMQWMIQRGFNRLVKKHFDAAGIEMPYPHSVVQFEGGRDGGMVPLRVRMGQSRSEGPRAEGSGSCAPHPAPQGTA
ncbi:MAG TPA: mechanosensitive ion channel domain-containing protein [Burkholderiaceae bacterium]|nr:mechanosensitive ion channel domain-containing protein [Burkholderiaceae bacterium]